MTFVPGVATPEPVPNVDPYVDLERQAETLALKLLRTFAADAPDDAYQSVGSSRVTAKELRALNQACLRARRLRT